MSAKPGYLSTDYRHDLAFYKTRLQRVVVGIGVLLLILYPLRLWTGTMSPSAIRQLTIATTIMTAIPAALALNLLTGLAGLVSLGTVAFIAVGAFSAAAFGAEAGLPMALVVLMGTGISAVLGTIVGIPALRLRGLYLVVATLALHFLVIYVARLYQDPRVGVAGFRMPRPEFLGHTFGEQTWYVIMATMAVLSTIAFVNLRRSRYGRAWMMIREREIAAEVLGINVTRLKVLAFTVSSAVIGFMGALFAYRLRTVEVESFHLDIAIDYVAIIIIGGLGSVHGAIFGTILVYGFPFLITEISLRLPRDAAITQFLGAEIYNLNRILYGLAIVLFLLFEPRGLAAMWARTRTWFDLWPFSRSRA